MACLGMERVNQITQFKTRSFADSKIIVPQKLMCYCVSRKRLGRRRKCWFELVTSNLSFCHSVFKRFCKQWGLFWKGLTKQQSFRLDQIESVCVQQNKRYSKIDVCD